MPGSRFPFHPNVLIAVLLLNLNSFGRHDGAVAQTATRLARQLYLQGTIRNADGTPLNTTGVLLKLTTDGVQQFIQSDGTCRTDPHMQGGLSRSIPIGESGRYAFETPLTEIRSGADIQCGVQLAVGRLDSLLVEASVEATQNQCAAFCRSQNGSELASCMTSCRSGSRRIRGAQTISREQLVLLDATAESGVATIDLDLKLDSLGPPLSSERGPDLAVDARSVETSARITTERFDADHCAVVEGCLNGPGRRKLMRFDGTIQNLGGAPLVLGAPEGNPLFQYSACHNHFHLQDVMLYELLDAITEQPVRVGGSAVIGRKQGFCLEDSTQVAGAAALPFFDCSNQGVSAGWIDIYDSSLDCQWIDVTDVAPGQYLLRVTVNPAGRYSESRSTNNSGIARVEIP